MFSPEENSWNISAILELIQVAFPELPLPTPTICKDVVFDFGGLFELHWQERGHILSLTLTLTSTSSTRQTLVTCRCWPEFVGDVIPRIRLATQVWAWFDVVEYLSAIFPTLIAKGKTETTVDYGYFIVEWRSSSLVLRKGDVCVVSIDSWLSFVHDMLPHIKTMMSSPEAYAMDYLDANHKSEYWISATPDSLFVAV